MTPKTGNFETYFAAEAGLSPEEIKKMRSLALEKKIRRRHFLLKEGEICYYKTFVMKGLLKAYCRKEDGSESVMRFSPENSWVTDAESFKHHLPSKLYIEALEDSEVLLWTLESLEALQAEIPALKSYTERLIARTLNASFKRILMNISATSEEKYRDFITSFPDVFSRVPLHMVASYLGVSRETLSRIRHAELNGARG